MILITAEEMNKSILPISESLPKHIKKGHQIVFSRQNLSPREADMFAIMMAYMSPEDWITHTPTYKFNCHQLAEVFEIESRYVGIILDPAAERLSKKTIGIKTENAKGEVEFSYTPLFKKIEYKNGVLTMRPNDELKSDYIEYNKGFALINTRNYLKLKREYSKRLYELLSRFKNGGTKLPVYTINELQGLFGLLDHKNKLKSDKSSFSNNSVFMQRCIRDSIIELNDNTQVKKELHFFKDTKSEQLGYEAIKQGRKYVGIKFLYKWVSGVGVESLNNQAAMEIVRTLETKRRDMPLTIKELTHLSDAYRALNKHDIVDKINKTIDTRQKQEEEQSKAIDETNAVENLLKEIHGDKEEFTY
jgi:plasmid replication initiation protein